MRESDVPFLLDGAQLAERLGITERHVRRLVAERRISFVKVGRFVRFDPDAIRRWLAEREVDGVRVLSPGFRMMRRRS